MGSIWVIRLLGNTVDVNFLVPSPLHGYTPSSSSRLMVGSGVGGIGVEVEVGLGGVGGIGVAVGIEVGVSIGVGIVGSCLDTSVGGGVGISVVGLATINTAITVGEGMVVGSDVASVSGVAGEVGVGSVPPQPAISNMSVGTSRSKSISFCVISGPL